MHTNLYSENFKEDHLWCLGVDGGIILGVKVRTGFSCLRIWSCKHGEEFLDSINSVQYPDLLS
jgi:hypothetical protein